MSEQPKRKDCLVIGPYGEAGTEQREWSDWVYREIVKPVAEDEEFAYRANRTIDDPQPGEIPGRIMRSLRAADLVVADLTWANPNVYYELALRHATGRPFVHLAREGTKLPFDLEVMNVILMAKGREADAREQLRLQLKPVKDGDLSVFRTPACEPQRRFLAKAYNWEITYSTNLADEWLRQQDRPIQEAVANYKARGGFPDPKFLRDSLLEYLSYRLSQGKTVNVELFYLLDTQNRRFEGWGVSDPLPGGEQLTLRVRGYEDGQGGRIKLHFDQPLRHVELPPLEGSLGPFSYDLRLETSQPQTREFTADFFHPSWPKDVRVGSCVLQEKLG